MIIGVTSSFVACNKVNPTKESKNQNTQKSVSEKVLLDDEDLSSELLEFTDTIVLVDEQGNEARLLATSNDLSVIEEYKQDGDLMFELQDKPTSTDPSTDTSSSEVPDEVSEIIPNDSKYIRFFVVSNPANAQQLICFKSGPRHHETSPNNSVFKYVEDWSNLGTNIKINWVSNSNSQSGLEVGARYKNCGWCSKYTIADGVNMGSLYPVKYFAKSSAKRMYASVKSNYKNREVYIY